MADQKLVMEVEAKVGKVDISDTSRCWSGNINNKENGCPLYLAFVNGLSGLIKWKRLYGVESSRQIGGR